MSSIYHILNGDSLKDAFPTSIEGEIIVARECLIDGNVKGETLEDFYKTRAAYISETFNEVSDEDYLQKTASEFERIRNIKPESEINLWFEDDLFCQVNFWFVLHLIKTYTKSTKMFLVRPEKHTQYGFGGLNTEELENALTNKTPIAEAGNISKLWKAYQHGEMEMMLEIAHAIEYAYPFILNAVKAHIERSPRSGLPGRPEQSLIDIMEDLQTEEFGPVFSEFCKRESIYGFGDTQVKRMLDNLTAN